MQTRTISSPQQAQEHYSEVIWTPDSQAEPPMQVIEFTDGYLLSAAPTAASRWTGVGQGRVIVDRSTGTVTTHSSQAPSLTMQEHTRARRVGTFAGRQIWPWTTDQAETLVRLIRPEAEHRTFASTQPGEDTWVLVPKAIPTQSAPPPVSYAADGQTRTIWEYPGTTASQYPHQKEAGRIEGRRLYPPTS